MPTRCSGRWQTRAVERWWTGSSHGMTGALTNLCASLGTTRQAIAEPLAVIEQANLIATLKQCRFYPGYCSAIPYFTILHAGSQSPRSRSLRLRSLSCREGLRGHRDLMPDDAAPGFDRTGVTGLPQGLVPCRLPRSRAPVRLKKRLASQGTQVYMQRPFVQESKTFSFGPLVNSVPPNFRGADAGRPCHSACKSLAYGTSDRSICGRAQAQGWGCRGGNDP